ncbi:TetR/AcrR family transcriptional regulator [Nocardia cerradoensis]|uniref:Tetracycline repressor protein class E n=1 Tax=Nocardia cerradoensis TaxID=85688 RepID=A0A231HEM9_9NOCA|nr:TetR/AcrR family transcriptional regulator [Nocardia cerradoensis]NKY45384.1 TetR/AcrR family transcriptional regulator [Nocardia cerradoensis]OXR47431.1 Tetracycline repressor protein class E [Nocardia cerradoensis]
MTDREVPDHLARLWRLPVDAKLGRPAALDVDRVVATAVELADRDGLAAATLPKIAAALRVTPMSLYRHIGSKDELLVLMADAGMGAPPELPSGSWRSLLRAWALAQLDVHRARPWLTQLPITGPPNGPNTVAWMDAGLRAVRETSLDWPAKVGAIMVVSGYVREAFVTARQLEHAMAAADLDPAGALHDYSRNLRALVDRERLPDMAALLASGLFDAIEPAEAEPDSDFAFGLDLILDGVAATIAAATRSSGCGSTYR